MNKSFKISIIILLIYGISSFSLIVIGLSSNEIVWNESNKILVQVGMIMMFSLIILVPLLTPKTNLPLQTFQKVED